MPVMAAMVTWLSLWTPVCLAMGAANAAMPPSMECGYVTHSPGRQGDMTARCVQVSGFATYLEVKSAHTATHVFHPPAAAPLAWSFPAQAGITIPPVRDDSPPSPSRPLNLRYCVFLK